MATGLQINQIKTINLKGYRPFRDFTASQLGSLEILVGANGSGKSALFEFLRILRDGMTQEIPPGVIPDFVGQQIFHLGGSEQFFGDIEFTTQIEKIVSYKATILGPLGSLRVIDEIVLINSQSRLLQYGDDNLVNIREPASQEERNYKRPRPNVLALSTVSEPTISTVYALREYLRAWRFYSASRIGFQEIRRPILIEQEPILNEDASNLGVILNYIFTEQRDAFDILQQFLRSTVPGFKQISVKARGGPGQVMTFWHEGNLSNDLTLADLSDGVLRLLVWGVLCVHPNPPALVCIDEPEQGVHPRTLPFLAGMLKKLASRTQVIVATHSSYFLTQFDLSQIAVMRKENGEIRFVKPQDSSVLTAMLDDFGSTELEVLHRSDELEHFS